MSTAPSNVGREPGHSPTTPAPTHLTLGTGAGPVGIVSAMPQELAALLALMPEEQRVAVAGRAFWHGHLAGHEVVAVVAGIGKVAAATTATLLLQRFGARGVVFTGVAGGLGEGVQVGDTVVATAFLQHDMDASPLFPRHEMPGYGLSRFTTHPDWQQGLSAAAERTAARLAATVGPDVVSRFGLQAARVHQGLVISGDRFVATGAESEALRQQLPDALAVEMEGAAVAQVCHDHGVPFAAVRSISDRADNAAHVDFVRFVAEVTCHTSAHTVLDWLSHLPPLNRNG